MTDQQSEKLFLRALAGQITPRPPLWLMRQAGRYLPEYREIRAKSPSFMDFCRNSRLTTEATLQPIRRYGFDAAILFSDILVVPDAMGQKVSFDTGEGPRLLPLEDEAAIRGLDDLNLERLSAVFETIDRLKSELPPETALIGFCGAPWTVASYMIAGRGTPDQGPARLFAYRHKAAFELLIDRLVDASVIYLEKQIETGVEAVQIFDSWAGVLPRQEFDRWCIQPTKKIIARIKEKFPDIPVIVFPRGANTHLPTFATETRAQAMSLDTSTDVIWAADHIPDDIVIQGNLDPLALIVGGSALENSVDEILRAFKHRPHIFNLGHGILPQTPLENVQRLVDLVRAGIS
jgi:uroporphyrinogen decarboxylase